MPLLVRAPYGHVLFITTPNLYKKTIFMYKIKFQYNEMKGKYNNGK